MPATVPGPVCAGMVSMVMTDLQARSAGWGAVRSATSCAAEQLHGGGEQHGRTISASRTTAMASRTPSWRTLIRSLNMNGRAAAIITAAAPVATAAVRRSPNASV